MQRRTVPWLFAACALHAVFAVVACAQGAGTEDDPYLLDIDELLRQGYAVVVTPEDTLTFAEAGTDTVRVQAPRLRVSELVRRVGERMEQQFRELGEHAFTSLSRVEIVDDPGDPAGEVTEIVGGERVHVDADGEARSVRLFEHTRKWRDGELVEEESDEEMTEQWSDQARESAMSLPFLLMSAERYRYEILERTLIGEHLVFRIGFAPKSRFEPGIVGEVWIDYGDAVIRRMEGRMSGTSPAPLFLKDVPRFVWRQKQLEGRWVTDTIYAEMRLTDLPLLPDEIVVDARFVNWTVDGIELAEEE